MNYRALVLASVFALGANAALAEDGHDAIAVRDNLNGAAVQTLEGRAATAVQAPKARKAQANEPVYFDLAEQGNN